MSASRGPQTSQAAPARILPDWPAMMGIETACAYLDLSEHAFRLLAGRNGVRPVDLGGMHLTRWRRTDLDALVLRLGERGPVDKTAAPGADCTPSALDMSDPAELALERVARRVQGQRRGRV